MHVQRIVNSRMAPENVSTSRCYFPILNVSLSGVTGNRLRFAHCVGRIGTIDSTMRRSAKQCSTTIEDSGLILRHGIGIRFVLIEIVKGISSTI